MAEVDKRKNPVKFEYKTGQIVQINQAAAEILEKRGDGKIVGAVKAEKEAKTEAK